MTHGQSGDIKILIDGELYDAKLKNQFFLSNWAGHKDVIKIRYGHQLALAVKLRFVLKKSYEYLFAQKQIIGKSKRQIPLTIDYKEYIRLYLLRHRMSFVWSVAPNQTINSWPIH